MSVGEVITDRIVVVLIKVAEWCSSGPEVPVGNKKSSEPPEECVCVSCPETTSESLRGVKRPSTRHVRRFQDP